LGEEPESRAPNKSDAVEETERLPEICGERRKREATPVKSKGGKKAHKSGPRQVSKVKDLKRRFKKLRFLYEWLHCGTVWGTPMKIKPSAAEKNRS